VGEPLNDISSVGLDAGRLLAKALQARLRPARDPEYQALVERFRTDADLRQLTVAVAEGLGLRILDVGPTGLVLGCTTESPFALRVADYRANLTVDQRVAHGLLLLALAAYWFPSAEALLDDDDVVQSLDTPAFVGWLVELCTTLQAAEAQDPALGSPELRAAYRTVLERAETRKTTDGRRTPSTLSGMVESALEQLEKGGLVRRTGDRWTSTRAYRVQVRELAGHVAFEAVRAAANQVSTNRVSR
jgi:hypothetical protein